MWSEAPDYIVAEDRAQKRLRAASLSGRSCRDPEHWGCPRCEPEEYLEAMGARKDEEGLWWAYYAGYEATGWDKDTAKRRLLEKLRSVL